MLVFGPTMDDPHWNTFLTAARVTAIGIPAYFGVAIGITYWTSSLYILAGLGEVAVVFGRNEARSLGQDFGEQQVRRWIFAFRCLQAVGMAAVVVVFIIERNHLPRL